MLVSLRTILRRFYDNQTTATTCYGCAGCLATWKFTGGMARSTKPRSIKLQRRASLAVHRMSSSMRQAPYCAATMRCAVAPSTPVLLFRASNSKAMCRRCRTILFAFRNMSHLSAQR